FEYDPNNLGLVTRSISARGNLGQPPDNDTSTTYTYTSAGLVGVTVHPKAAGYPSGTTETFGYDAIGRKVQHIDEKGMASPNPLDFRWIYEYDAEDGLRFTRAPAPASGQAQLVTENQYDEERNLTAVVDANGNMVRYDYDERSLLHNVYESATFADPN